MEKIKGFGRGGFEFRGSLIQALGDSHFRVFATGDQHRIFTPRNASVQLIAGGFVVFSANLNFKNMAERDAFLKFAWGIGAQA